MPLRITGLNSQLDTESIIQEMVKAQKTKTDKLKKEQTKLQWKQDTWKELNSKIIKLYTKTLNTMRFQGNYAKKTTTVSHPNYVSVLTGGDAANTVQELEIVKQAKSGFMTGRQLTATGGPFTGSSKLSELDPANFGAGTSGNINVTVGGTTKSVSFDENTTISDFVSKLKEAGITANFDEKNQRFYLNAKDSGKAGDFSITSSDANGSKALEALGINASLADDKASLEMYKKYKDYFIEGDRTGTLANMQSMIDADVAARVAAYKASNAAASTSITHLDKAIADVKDRDGFLPGESVESITTKIDTLKAKLEDPTLTEGDKAVINEKIAELEPQLTNYKQIKAYEDEKVKQQKIIDDNNLYIDTDADGNVTAKTKLTDEVNDVYYNRAAYAKMVMDDYTLNGAPDTGVKRIAGQDAEIKLNGADYTSSKNTFEINGLTITVLGETTEKISINTKDDTDGIYDMIKGFIKEYNTIINEMDKLYNAEVAKGYEPLTDEEKESLSDKEVEKWEQKIKDSILRRDDTVGSVSRELKNVMMAGVELNGKQMYLSDFGINTLNYMLAEENQKNAYHIDNDPDDENTSQNPDKLKAAISNNPEEVMNFFSALTQNMYTSMQEMTSRTDFRTYNTAYNDKLMKTQYDDYTKKIAKQEAKVKALEDKWYAKFAAMETAMSKLNSSQSAISGLLGG